MNCCICESQKLRLHIIKNGFIYYKCLNCNLIQQYPIPEANFIKNIYNGDKNYFTEKTNEVNMREFLKIGSKQKFYFSLMNPHLKNKNIKILDIGASTGLMLKLLRMRGFKNLEGVELSRWACEIAKKNFNLILKKVDIHDADFPLNYFDFLILNHVIEHLRDPVNIFKKLNNSLKMGGKIFISTPNISCFNSKLVKEKWRYYIPNEHIILFDKNSISYFLKKMGFRIIIFKKNILYNYINSFVFLKQLIRPIIGGFIRKILGMEPSNNYYTFRDGFIVICEKVKNT